MSQIAPVLADGRYGMLGEFPSRGLHGSEIGSRIAHFLQVPFTDTRAPTIGETLSTVRDTVQGAMEKKNRAQ